MSEYAYSFMYLIYLGKISILIQLSQKYIFIVLTKVCLGEVLEGWYHGHAAKKMSPIEEILSAP